MTRVDHKYRASTFICYYFLNLQHLILGILRYSMSSKHWPIDIYAKSTTTNVSLTAGHWPHFRKEFWFLYHVDGFYGFCFKFSFLLRNNVIMKVNISICSVSSGSGLKYRWCPGRKSHVHSKKPLLRRVKLPFEFRMFWTSAYNI